MAMDTLRCFTEAFRRVDIWKDGGAVTALSAWAETEAEKAAKMASEVAARGTCGRVGAAACSVKMQRTMGTWEDD